MRLEAFRGTWAIARTINDVRGGRAGRFSGEARFTPSGDGLGYVEEGLLELGGGAYRASRRYHWRQAGGGAIEVWFEDGQFFHSFSADEPRPLAVHDCGADQYRVLYDLRRWPHWRAEWRVSGPAKDYGMVSDYRPAGQAE